MPTSAAQFRTADTDRRGWRQSSSRIDFAPPMCALPHSTPDAGGPISRFSGASPDEPKMEPEGSIMSQMGTETLSDTTKGEVMGKLEGKVAVITGGSSGMALASAKRFVEEGAYVFITGRRQEALDEAVKLIGRNVTGVRGDAANLDDLNRLFRHSQAGKGQDRRPVCERRHGRSRQTGRDYRAALRCGLRPECARNAVCGSEGVAAVQRWRIDLHDRVRLLR